MIVHDVEQRSDEWFALRAGMPTASEFSKLVTSTGEPSKSMKDYAELLAAEKYAGRPLSSFSGNASTQRGVEMEAEAIMAYELAYHEVEPVGFVTDDLQRYGCSPDGLVGADGLVEIKCLETKAHVKALLYFAKHQKTLPKYIAQTQGQIFICEREWCDSLFYHPHLPMLVIRQFPDPDFVRGLKIQLAAVIQDRDEVFRQIKIMDAA